MKVREDQLNKFECGIYLIFEICTCNLNPFYLPSISGSISNSIYRPFSSRQFRIMLTLPISELCIKSPSYVDAHSLFLSHSYFLSSSDSLNHSCTVL